MPPASNLWDSEPADDTLADAIKARGTGGPMYLGFPGPSEGIPHYSANWTTYWNAYASSVNSHYDWIALHPYATTFQGLKDDAYGQATKIHTLFPSRPVRFTEYGIPIDGEPAGNHSTRGGFYRDFVTWLRSGWCDYVYAAHVFIGRDSSGDDTARFQLTDAEAAIITNGVGCVGQ